MKIHFESKASIQGWNVILDNFIEVKDGVFEHSILFDDNLIAKRKGIFDKHCSFDKFLSWRAQRARFHFEESTKKKATV